MNEILSNLRPLVAELETLEEEGTLTQEAFQHIYRAAQELLAAYPSDAGKYLTLLYPYAKPEWLKIQASGADQSPVQITITSPRVARSLDIEPVSTLAETMKSQLRSRRRVQVTTHIGSGESRVAMYTKQKTGIKSTRKRTIKKLK